MLKPILVISQSSKRGEEEPSLWSLGLLLYGLLRLTCTAASTFTFASTTSYVWVTRDELTMEDKTTLQDTNPHTFTRLSEVNYKVLETTNTN